MLIDVNVVLAMFTSGHPHHASATAWFAEAQRRHETFGCPASVLHAYVRLVTNRAVLDPPTTIDEALTDIETLARHAEFRRLEPGPRHLDLFRRACASGTATRNLVNDAALAAIAVEHGAVLASFDRDFARFPDLRWIVPGE